MNRLEQIEAREKAATPGPWGEASWPSRSVITPDETPIAMMYKGSQWEANNLFIAHAREDIPALLAVVRAAGDFVREDDWCFYCNGPVKGLDLGHLEDCPLAALLEEVPE